MALLLSNKGDNGLKSQEVMSNMEINSNFIPPKYLTDHSVVAKLTTMLEQPGSNIDFILNENS